MHGSLISVDDPTTWPAAVHEWVNPYADTLLGTTSHTSDLAVPIEREDELRALLARYKLIAYHCARLLDHEVEGIRVHGLRPLTHELVVERIERAHEHGHLSEAERGLLRERNVFGINEAEYRENQVCLVLGRDGLDDTGVVPLMSRWGGEAIYMVDPDSEASPAFLGRPTIVVTAVDLSVIHTVSPTFPSLGRLFVGTVLGTEQRYADREDRERGVHLPPRWPGSSRRRDLGSTLRRRCRPRRNRGRCFARRPHARR
jgi:hypothetical protein